MIYIVSEDVFFTVGVTSILKRYDMDSVAISLHEFGMIHAHITNQDVFLMCIHNQQAICEVAVFANHTAGKFIYFIDVASDKVDFQYSCSRIISKKSPTETVIQAIVFVNNSPSVRPVSFSCQEEVIMDLLAQQKDAYRIARLLNLSVKTVFAHKLNAIKKMGVNHLNARAILLYESIF